MNEQSFVNMVFHAIRTNIHNDDALSSRVTIIVALVQIHSLIKKDDVPDQWSLCICLV